MFKKKVFTQKMTLALGFLCLHFSINAQAWQQKVHEAVFDNLRQTTSTDVFIVLVGEADISAAASQPTKSTKGQFVFNTLRTFAQNSQQDIQSFLQHERIPFEPFWVINALYLRGDAALIQTLASRSDVKAIINNPRSSLQRPTIDVEPRSPQSVVIPWGILKIKADSVWQMGIKGQGVVVGGADTGYDWTHPALKPKYRGWNGTTANHSYNWFDAILPDSITQANPCGPKSAAPCDDDNHGTHTMGTMIGSTDSMSIGVAPEARWIAARNMDRGNGTLARYIACFQWFIAPTDSLGRAPNPDLAPHVINNSWYCSTGEGCNTANFNLLENALNAARAAGIVPVVSVGNAGSSCGSATGPPGFFAKAFSVGATAQNDTIAGFSSRGAVTIDGSGRIKPDVSAPGVGILSTLKGGTYSGATWNGTSMAGPHVAGTVALMISANPRLAGQVDTIERILEETAKHLTSNQSCGGISGAQIPNNTYGYGRIDALAAVKAALLYRPTRLAPTEMTGSVTVAPNPTSGQTTLLIDNWKGTARLEVYNLNGQILLSEQQTIGDHAAWPLALDTMPEGVYLYKIMCNNQFFTGKIIKK